MLDTVLKSTFTTQDVAFALQHPGFANFQREMTRLGVSILPRKRTPGPGGGDYRYAHLLEHGLQMAIGATRSRAVAKSVCWGLLRLLQGNNYGIKKLNKMSQKERNAVMFGGSGWEQDDYPEGAPHDLTQMVDFPTLYFGEDFISRDPKAPTFLLFDSSPMQGSAADVRLTGSVSLVEAHQLLIDMMLPRAGSDRMEEIYRERFDDLPIVNLTAMLARIDARLDLRLKAKMMREA